MAHDPAGGAAVPFMLRNTGTVRAANLPESQLLYKRAASHARGVSDSLTDIAAITTPGVSFALSGPSVKLDPAHLPVRGDLAHIRLAGKVFVPHYVVPMPHQVNGNGAQIRAAGRSDADVIAELASGAPFQVLDVTGGWAWGQACAPGSDAGGVVGYVPADALVPAE